MNQLTTLTTIAKAEDTSDLLEHIAWKDIIHPALTAYRLRLQEDLTSMVLGGTANCVSPSGSQTPMSKEQLAGIIYGLKYIETLFTSILTKGAGALKALEASGSRVSFIPNN